MLSNGYQNPFHVNNLLYEAFGLCRIFIELSDGVSKCCIFKNPEEKNLHLLQ